MAHHTGAVIRLYQRGKTLDEIAAVRKISRETVRRILKDNRVTMRPRGRRKIT